MHPKQTRYAVSARAIVLTALLLFPHAAISGAASASDGPGSPDVPPLTWESLEAWMDRAAADGFTGSVLVAREGKVVLDRGYGLANPAKKIPNRADTIYAVGSTPIDFTRAGILLLAQEGKLSLDDTLAKYFKGIPADKAPITLEQLMSGRSGLRDFLGRPSDANPDHFYIDRDEAMRRIFEDELLFAPGTRERHSHAAWGVLAAVIEIVSGKSYPQFTRQRLFDPAGMDDTGFFGVEYPEERMAVGLSPRTSGKVNAPPYWGPTSWLVMGSGGQVSTTRDLYRWHQALAAGKILHGQWLDRYWEPAGALLNGGDMFGFEVFYSQGPETMFILMSNAGGKDDRVQRLSALARELSALVLAGPSGRPGGDPPPFTLGVELGVLATDEGSQVVIERVIKGTAAERDGLRRGDQLISANRTPLGDDPLSVLSPFLATGRPVTFEILREGHLLIVEVVPRPR